MLYNAITAILVLALVTIIVLTQENERLPQRDRKLFTLAFLCLGVAVLSEWAGVQLSGKDIADGWLLILAKLLDYIFTPTSAILIASIFLSKRMLQVSLGVLAFNMALQLASVPTGMTFFLDDQLVYHHGPLYWVYALVDAYAVLVLAGSLFNFGKTHPKNNSASLVLTIILVLAGTLAQMVNSDMRVTNMSLILTAAILLAHYSEYIQQEIDSALSATSSENALRERIISCLTDTYLASYFISLKERSVTTITSDKHIDKVLEGASDIQDKLQLLISDLVSENYQEQMTHFLNFSTLGERLAVHTSISYEFISSRYGWCRVFFTVVDRDSRNVPETVLLTISIIEEEKRYETELRAISITDALTGLNNQRAYFEALMELSENGMPDDLVLGIIDVNGLKLINDTFGHDVGDELLMGAGECVKRSFEQLGSCFRLGGDEFALVLRCSKEQYLQARDILLTRCASWRKDPITHISIATGAAFREDNRELSLDQLSKKADLDMYEDKRRYYQRNGIDRRRS